MFLIETPWHSRKPQHVTSFITQSEKIILSSIWGCIQSALHLKQRELLETCLTYSALHARCDL